MTGPHYHDPVTRKPVFVPQPGHTHPWPYRPKASDPIRIRYAMAVMATGDGYDPGLIERIAASVDAEYATHEDAAGPPDWEQWKYLLPRFVNFR